MKRYFAALILNLIGILCMEEIAQMLHQVWNVMKFKPKGSLKMKSGQFKIDEKDESWFWCLFSTNQQHYSLLERHLSKQG